MTTLSRVSLGFLAAFGFSLSAGATGCKPDAADENAQDTADSFDAEVRGQLRTALRIVAKCGKRGGGALDAACVAAARNDAAAMPVDAVVDQVPHGAICRALRSFSGDATAYYVQGASVPGGQDGESRVEVVRVWDLRRAQFAAFASGSTDISAAGSIDAEAFTGFAESHGEEDVVATWAGRSFSAGGDYESPLRTGGTADARVHDDRDELRMQLGFGPAAQSLSSFVLGPAATALAHDPLGPTTAAAEELTKSMHVLDGAEAIVASPKGSFVSLRANGGLEAGTALAVHLLQLSAGQAGSFAGALAAVVADTSRRIDTTGRCSDDDVLSTASVARPQGIAPRNTLIVGQSTLLNFDFDPLETQPVDPSPDPAADHLESEIVLAAFIGCQSLGWSDWTTGCFTGDNRGYDYGSAMSRSRLAGRAMLAGEGAPSTQAYVGETHSLNCADTVGDGTCTEIKEGAQIQATKRAPISSIKIQPVGLSPSQDKVRIVFSGKNPLVALAPAIDGTVDVFVSYEVVDGRRTRVAGYSISGSHDGFPAWEMYINGTRVHEYDPIPNGCTPLSLAGGCSQQMSGSFAP